MEISESSQAGGQTALKPAEKRIAREKLILASKSPRRAEVLRAVNWPFEPVTAGIDETRKPLEDAVTYVQRLAREKAGVVAQKFSAGLVLGADTVVVVDEEILGQPRDQDDAKRMLRMLSGRWHDVITGVALMRAENGSVAIGHELTRVRFTEMTNEEIAWYASSEEPRDKAGAYAVQGIAALFVEEIQGDYFNIMGLPVRLVYNLAQKI